jgi:hypothetical protein
MCAGCNDLLDHFVGAGEHRRRDVEAERLGRPEIDHKLVFGRRFFGRIERGFDFLGYRFGPTGLSVAKQTIANFIEKASRLYEQKRRAGSARATLEMYARRWVRWANGGLVIPRVVLAIMCLPERT